MRSSWVRCGAFEALTAPLEKCRSVLAASLEQNSRDLDTIDVANLNARLASGRNQCRQAHTKNDCVCLGDSDGVGQAVVTRLQDHMESLTELSVDLRSRVFLIRHINLAEGDLDRVVVTLRWPDLVELRTRRHETVAGATLDNVRLLNDGRSCRYRSVRLAAMVRAVTCGSSLGANKHHVPISSADATHFVVSEEELLLTARVNSAAYRAV